MKILKQTVCLILVAFGIIAFQPTAHAQYMQFSYWDPNNMAGAVYVDDNTAGVDLDSRDGVMLLNLSTPDWNLSGSIAATYNTLGTAASPQLDLANLSVSSASGGELLLGVSAINYTGPNGWNFEVGGTTAGSVSFDAYFDSGNTFFGGSSGPIGSLFGSTGAFSGQVLAMANEFDFGIPYSLSITADILHGDYDSNGVLIPGGVGATSFDANLAAVPEPASLILLGCGLIGLLGIRRRITC